jgi:hypothetical protein
VLPHHPDGLQRLPKQCWLLKSNFGLNNDWPSVRTVLLWRPNIFIVICKTLRGACTPSKACSNGCTWTGCFDLEIAWNLHGPLLRNLWPNTWHEMRHCPYYLKTSNRTDNPVKSNRYIKCFCQPGCCEYKILTNSSFGHSGTKNTWPVWKYIPGPKQKILPLFVSKGQRVNRV